MNVGDIVRVDHPSRAGFYEIVGFDGNGWALLNTTFPTPPDRLTIVCAAHDRQDCYGS